ncbi:hypothetical protein CCHR01_10278 [Colletotrichum chrysophilum]|uniref:Uncharacterized protein n=1 Tax=Colletotrichum chrysophilum TaxID=1836956 RepID=A0AAD9EJJ2_9PEZI|nr:hypothetical protein CCHR01_10278 [Colletotrichum chrysophilum]
MLGHHACLSASSPPDQTPRDLQHPRPPTNRTALRAALVARYPICVLHEAGTPCQRITGPNQPPPAQPASTHTTRFTTTLDNLDTTSHRCSQSPTTEPLSCHRPAPATSSPPPHQRPVQMLTGGLSTDRLVNLQHPSDFLNAGLHHERSIAKATFRSSSSALTSPSSTRTHR